MEKQNAGYANSHNQFEKLIKGVEAMGLNYKPTQSFLQVPNLYAFHATIEPMTLAYDDAKRICTNVTKKRISAFNTLSKKVQRIAAVAIGLDMLPHTLDSIMKHKDAITGNNVSQATAEFNKKVKKAEKAKEKGEKVEEPSKGRSVSQQAFSLKLSNFKLMLSDLAASGVYITNEEDLTLDALKEYWNELNAINNEVAAVDNALEIKLAERNNLLAGETNSMKSIADAIKNYLQTKAEGKKGVAYKQIKDIKFASIKVE